MAIFASNLKSFLFQYLFHKQSTREYFTRTAIAAQSWIAVLDLPSRTAIDRSPESRTAIQDYDEIAFVVLVVVLIAVLIAVLIVVLDF